MAHTLLMTQDEKIPPNAVKPANANAPRPRRSAKNGPPLSPESKFIGFLVLGFGVIAVIAVLILAFSKRGGDNAPDPAVSNAGTVSEQTQKEIEAGLAPTINRPPQQDPAIVPPANVAQDLSASLSRDLAKDEEQARKASIRKEFYFDRQKDFKLSSAQGTWVATVGRYTAVMTIADDKFQIVMADVNKYGTRYYSSGFISQQEDILILDPHDDWPPPATPPGQKIDYNVIARSKFPALAAIHGGKMYWQNPPQRLTKVSVPYMLPIIMGQNQDYIIWHRPKQ